MAGLIRTGILLFSISQSIYLNISLGAQGTWGELGPLLPITLCWGMYVIKTQIRDEISIYLSK
jgi:hypothetical protein